jgi:hypothetical protein
MASIVHDGYAPQRPPSAVAEDRNHDNVTPLKICARFWRPPSAPTEDRNKIRWQEHQETCNNVEAIIRGAEDRNIGTNGTGVGCPQGNGHPPGWRLTACQLPSPEGHDRAKPANTSSRMLAKLTIYSLDEG